MKKIIIKTTEDEISKNPNDATLGKLVRDKYNEKKEVEERYDKYNWEYPGPK